jgi:metal-responsive CopG/Arc/MetJ family transcriptional regulator
MDEDAGKYEAEPGLARIVHATYLSSMKCKTSITLSEVVLEALDRMAPEGASRSETIERLLRSAIALEARKAKDLKDLEVINENAESLNEEAEDVLTYQVEP